MTRQSTNPFEHLARIAKSNALIAAIDASGLSPTSREVRLWNDETWRLLTEIANRLGNTDPTVEPKRMSVPSIRTREMVANQLAARERLTAPRGNVVPVGAAELPIFTRSRQRRSDAIRRVLGRGVET